MSNLPNGITQRDIDNFCSPRSPLVLDKQKARMEAVLAEIDEYVGNYVDIDWEGRPNWAMNIKVMLEKLS